MTLILAEMSAALFGGLLTGAHFTFQPPRQRRYLSRGPYAECPYKSIFIFVSPNFDPKSNDSYSALIVCLLSMVNICSASAFPHLRAAALHKVNELTNVKC